MTGRPDRPEWIATKVDGDAAELAVAVALKALGWQVVRHDHSDIDLTITGGVEVKCDRMANNTGNVAIEVGYKDRPSGISVTKAVLWAICIRRACYIIQTSTLRAMVSSLKAVSAGEHAMVKLLPLEDLRKNARFVWL